MQLAALMALVAACAACAAPAHADNWTLTKLNNPGPAQGEMVLGADGSFYGTTSKYPGTTDPIFSLPAIWKMTSGGDVTMLHQFGEYEGYPIPGLVQGPDGNFYGATAEAYPATLGTLFKITPNGTLTTLHTFSGLDGYLPSARLILGSDGNLYGMTRFGGAGWIDQYHPGFGTVFKMTPDGTLTVLHSFNSLDGVAGTGPLVQGTDGALYGGTDYGGPDYAGTFFRMDGSAAATGSGVLFKITTAGTFTLLHTFAGTDTKWPYAGLIQAIDGNFYGATASRGAYNNGTIFKMSSTGTLTTFLSFHNMDGNTPCGRLLQAPDGNFYGTMTMAGAEGSGTIYQVTPAGVLTVLHTFGWRDKPSSGLVLGPDGAFYGTEIPGAYVGIYPGIDRGGVYGFRKDASAPVLTSVTISPSFASVIPSSAQRFSATAFDQWGNPLATQPRFTWTVSGGGTMDGGIFSVGQTPGGPYTITASSGALSATASTVIESGAGPTLTTLYDFAGLPQEGVPQYDLNNPLVLGNDGNFYGTRNTSTSITGLGYVYRITPSGVVTRLYQFNYADGENPNGPLLLATDGNFYGTAYPEYQLGDILSYPVLFKMTPDGLLMPFGHTPAGEIPMGPLIQATDGNFYGAGPGFSETDILQITPAGNITIFAHTDPSKWYQPSPSMVTQGLDGSLYSSSITGGIYGSGSYGTICRSTPGAITAIHSFNGLDGGQPFAGLLLAKDGNFYGCTLRNGPSYPGYYDGYGTIFKVTPAGDLTTLHEFQGTDGSAPVGNLMQARDGYLYGTGTDYNQYFPFGTPDYGTIFKISTGGVFKKVYSFQQVDGSLPKAALVEAPDGNFYGTTSRGGENNLGTVFRLNTGPRTASSIAATPFSSTIHTATKLQFKTIVLDQNGSLMSGQLPTTWAVSGGGTIDAHGLFSARTVPGGPFTITATSGTMTSTATVTLTPNPMTTDFNGDGKPDLVLQNSSTRQVALWYLNGATVSGGGYVPAMPPANWRIAAVGDFNGDGKPDLVLQSTLSSLMVIWYMNGPTVQSTQTITATPPGDVVCAFDVNGDGNTDLVFQNKYSGEITYWDMNGAVMVNQHGPGLNPPSNWKVVGHGDVNRDNLNDIVLQNTVTHQVAFWYLSSAGSVIGGGYLATTPPAAWSVVAAGDYSGDGMPDLVLQNATTNQVALWYVNGTTVTGGQYLATTPPANWKVVGPR